MGCACHSFRCERWTEIRAIAIVKAMTNRKELRQQKIAGGKTLLPFYLQDNRSRTTSRQRKRKRRT
jgi:hypothetical protein